jgi:hypothetical protein
MDRVLGLQVEEALDMMSFEALILQIGKLRNG